MYFIISKQLTFRNSKKGAISTNQSFSLGTASGMEGQGLGRPVHRHGAQEGPPDRMTRPGVQSAAEEGDFAHDDSTLPPTCLVANFSAQAFSWPLSLDVPSTGVTLTSLCPERLLPLITHLGS